MTDRQIIFTGLAIGFAIYTPASMYLFDTTLSTMLERAYFMLGGAAIALYAPRTPQASAEANNG